jgi:hypothetical protein
MKKRSGTLEGLKDGWQIFLHDNWAVHTARNVKKYLEKQSFKTVD